MRLLFFTDLVIAASYYAIPVALLFAIPKNRSIWARRILWLFAGFIVFCGSGHLIDAWFTWRNQCSARSPLKEFWNVGTAALSVLTAIVIIPNLPIYLMALRSPLTIQYLMEQLEQEE